VARIELSAEVRAIESLIDTGQQGTAATRLQAAHANLGRRPEYRYLVCLYDSKFRVRPGLTKITRDSSTLIAWFIALALGRVPKGMRDLMAYCLRYNAQTYAYLLLLTDRYPTLASGSGFQFEEG